MSLADVSQPDAAARCKWRSTANCSVDGEREPERDTDCSFELPWCKGTSGWCDCNGDSIRQVGEPGFNCNQIRQMAIPLAANCTDEHCTNFTCDIACSISTTTSTSTTSTTSTTTTLTTTSTTTTTTTSTTTS